jgi:hypothetical protein
MTSKDMPSSNSPRVARAAAAARNSSGGARRSSPSARARDPVVLLVEGPASSPRVAGVSTLQRDGPGSAGPPPRARPASPRTPALGASQGPPAPLGGGGAGITLPGDPSHIIGFIAPALLREPPPAAVPTVRASPTSHWPGGAPRARARGPAPGRPRLELDIVSAVPLSRTARAASVSGLDAALEAAWTAPPGYAPPAGWVPPSPRAAAAAAPPPPPGSDIAGLMNRVTERAVRAEIMFNVDPGVHGVSDVGGGGRGDSATPDNIGNFRAQQAEMRTRKAAARRDEAAAKRARAAGVAAGGGEARKVPRFMMAREKEALAAKKRLEKRKKKREALRAVEATREARERELMNAEEWRQCRLKWYGGKNAREGTWRTVRVFISSTFNGACGCRAARGGGGGGRVCDA